jgi:hypothetical protein
MKKRDVTTDTIEIQSIIRDNYILSPNLGNLEEWVDF